MSQESTSDNLGDGTFSEVDEHNWREVNEGAIEIDAPEEPASPEYRVYDTAPPANKRRKKITVKDAAKAPRVKAISQKAEADLLASIQFNHACLEDLGEPKAGMESENVLKFGYPSIKCHYIEGPGDLTKYALAKMWNVDAKLLLRWVRDGHWDDLREKHYAARPAGQGKELAIPAVESRSESAIEQQRAKFLAREFQFCDDALTVIEAKLNEKTEDYITPFGLERGKKSSGSIKNDVSSAVAILNQTRLNMGLPTKGAANFAGATINNTQINMIEESRPAERDTRNYVHETLKEVFSEEEMALMDADIEEGIVEGEVLGEEDAT